VGHDELGCGARHGQEAVVLGHEVGFAVHFQQGTHLAFNVAGDHAFSGDAARGLAGFAAELDAQELFGLGHVATGLGQGLLALHHGGVGLRTKLGHHPCGNCRHHHLSCISGPFGTKKADTTPSA